MSSVCLHRWTVPIFTSGWVEVSSVSHTQYHWWEDKLEQAYIRLQVFLWVMMIAISCQVLIWWGDSRCSRVQMSRRSAILEDPSSSAWARQHSYAQPSKFIVQLQQNIRHLLYRQTDLAQIHCTAWWRRADYKKEDQVNFHVDFQSFRWPMSPGSFSPLQHVWTKRNVERLSILQRISLWTLIQRVRAVHWLLCKKSGTWQTIQHGSNSDCISRNTT